MTTPYGWPLFVLRMRPRERYRIGKVQEAKQ